MEIGNISNPWQALVLLAAIIVPQVIAYLKVRSTKASVAAVEHTLTETNSGSTVRDALNRIEVRLEEQAKSQVAQSEILDALESRMTILEEEGS